MRRRFWLGLVAWATLQSTALAALTGYESLGNWNDLPLAKTAVTAGLASSYDREGGNFDYNYYLWPEDWQTGDAETVITELAGPGLITRFQMPHAAANQGFTVRMIVDGTVRIDTTSDTFLGGAYGYAQAPLVQTLVGGQVSYEPIAFQNSLRIESNNFGSGGFLRTHHYYQYDYHLLPPGQTVTPYDGSLTAAQQADRDAVVNMIQQVGANPAGPSGAATVLATPGRTLAGGSSLVLADLAGTGQVRRLNLKMPDAATDADLDGLRLRISYDGRGTPAVDVPVAHFFGAGHGRAPYKSLPVGTDSPDGFYAYWPMPFRQGAVVELYNSTASPIVIDAAQLEYETGPVAQGAGYLHAVHAEEVTATGQGYHPLLTLPEASGHYLGSLLYVERAGDSRWILEGDDIITVNPGLPNQAVLYGNGMEDAYNGGYYYNHVAEQTDDGDVADPAFGFGPYNGLLYIDFFDMPGFTRTRADQYRWLIPDYVPFQDGIDVRVENHYATADVLFGSTAFFYATPAALVWTGAEDGAWDVAQTANWSDGSPDATFRQGDRVVFDDTGSGALPVNIGAAVRPWSVLVEADAVDFEFTGPGAIDGPCSLTKRGLATLTLAAANTYTGQTRANAGTLIVAAEGALGASAVELGDTTDPSDAAILVSGAFTVDRPVTVRDDGSGTSTQTLGGTNPAGAAVFSGHLTLEADLTLTAAPGGTVEWTGAIDNAGGHTLTKVGEGTVVFGGTQTHGAGALLEILAGTVYLDTDAGSEMAAGLSITVTAGALYFGCDQHLDTLTVGDGGTVGFAGARIISLEHLVMGGVDLGATTLTPEPATLSLLGLAGLAAVLRRSRDPR